jgi:hypothetical protein
MNEEANRDETITRTFQIEKPRDQHGVSRNFAVRVTFFPNRINWEATDLEDEDEDSDGNRTTLRAATNFVEYVKEWDMTGPWNPPGLDPVDDDVMIPITVSYVRATPAYITSQVMAKMAEAVFPNANSGRRSRRG